MSLKTLDDSGALIPAPRNLPTELFVDFERRDDAAILAELQGAIVEEYVYSFRQGGATVMGLSLPGVMAVAQNMGGITCGQPIWTITDDDITCDISATDHKVGLTVWGTASAALRDNRGPDKFARAKALSKAQRNAIRKVIPETVATQMLKAFIGGKSPERQRPPSQMQRPDPPQPIAAPVEVIQASGDDYFDTDGSLLPVAVTGDPAEDVPRMLALLEASDTPRKYKQASGYIIQIGLHNDPEIAAVIAERDARLAARQRREG